MTENIENSLNNLIAEVSEKGGHVYIVDKKRNTFALKLTEPVMIKAFVPTQKGCAEDSL